MTGIHKQNNHQLSKDHIESVIYSTDKIKQGKYILNNTIDIRPKTGLQRYKARQRKYIDMRFNNASRANGCKSGKKGGKKGK